MALALLSTAGALIGNARWAQPWDEWTEPPMVNAALLGNPSSGKSPGLDAVAEALRRIEGAENEDSSERRRQHTTAKRAAAAHKDAWEQDVKAAIMNGAHEPLMPAAAEDPPDIQRRQVVLN